jgi:type III secretion protein C
MPGRNRQALLASLVAILTMWEQSVVAAEIHWRTDNFNYVAQGKPLKDFIREFATSQGVNVVVDPQIEGTVNGKFNLTPQNMLDLLATSFGLTWYYDGSVLYFYPAGEMSSEVIQLGTTTVDQLQATLARLDVLDKRYPPAYDRRHETARVSGPKRYVELVKETVSALERSSSGPAGSASEIRVFPLRYAWAADFTYVQGGREHRVPGVASVLRDLYTPPQHILPSTSAATSPLAARVSTLGRLQGLGYFRDDQLGALSAEARNESPPVLEAPGAPMGQPEVMASPGSGAGLPQFQPDGRMNAVIVRDRPERMASYESLIRSLDVKPGLVEIEARILEVSSDAIDSLGIDWRLHSGSADAQFSRNSLPALGYGTALAPGAPQAGPTTNSNATGSIPSPGITPPIPSADLQRGTVLTTVIGDSGRFLIARINALSQEGKANMLASPRVLTLDNVEAVLENLSTFFVRVSGNLDAQLYDVSAGTSLRVTPLIVTEEGHRRIKLAVRIEDGTISGQSVDQIPIVQRSTIDTQAFVREGESLLIGGYENDVRNDTQVGVPGLSSIPLLGRLFKFNEKEVTHVQRLFMLTPHVVDP